MNTIQTGILATETQHARYLSFSLVEAGDLGGCLQDLVAKVDGQSAVVGIGLSVVKALGKKIVGLRNMPVMSGKGIDIPSTPNALWLWLRGTDRGELLHRSRELELSLLPAFVLNETIDAFRYGDGLDISGYEDGTENPKDDDVMDAAIVRGQGAGMDGSSFVAVQQWLHDMEAFDAMSGDEQDNSIGRRKSDNEELADAPASAHVKRTAQEDFEPEAFVVRRSMPWMDGMSTGLNFVAFGKSFDAFEAQLNRMVGLDDGISDALFTFTRPVSGAYYWCPPMKDGVLDLGALGL